MCLEPTTLYTDQGEPFEVWCRKCWQCTSRRVDDLTGRCLAESEVSDQTLSVTLTYKDDTPHAAVLVYEDVQKFLKRFRKAGYNVRYLCAGEYGSKKGRAHWHIVLFLKGKTVPICDAWEVANSHADLWKGGGAPVPTERVAVHTRLLWKFWPHGHAYFQQAGEKGVRYCLKYVLKDLSADVSTGTLTMSKKPPLGYQFFMRLAQKRVAQRLPLQDYTYTFRHSRHESGKRAGKHRRYYLQGRMRELYIDAYEAAWEAAYPGEEPPQTEALEKHQDKRIAANPSYKMARAHRDKLDLEQSRKYLAGLMKTGLQRFLRDRTIDSEAAELQHKTSELEHQLAHQLGGEARNPHRPQVARHLLDEGTDSQMIVMDDGTIHLEVGDNKWQAKGVGAKSLVATLIHHGQIPRAYAGAIPRYQPTPKLGSHDAAEKFGKAHCNSKNRALRGKPSKPKHSHRIIRPGLKTAAK